MKSRRYGRQVEDAIQQPIKRGANTLDVEGRRDFVTDDGWQTRGNLLKKVELPRVRVRQLAARNRDRGVKQFG